MSRHPLESALVWALRSLLIWGVPLSAAALIFPAPEPGEGLFVYLLAHLVVMQLITLGLTLRLAQLAVRPMFPNSSRPWLAGAAALVAVAVGFAALLSLATSAAARYHPSLQFLQLLSSLDIAWVVAALYLGARRLWKSPIALTGALGLLGACVLSIGIYLDVVGFSPDGGWVVQGSEMARIVISADVAAAVTSTAVLLAASGRPHPTLQPKPQS